MAGFSPRPLLNRRFVMQIFLNGVAQHCADQVSLASFLDSIGITPTSCATAVNQVFVAREQRATTILKPNDQIMTFEPITGG